VVLDSIKENGFHGAYEASKKTMADCFGGDASQN
jgi:hypothetical protein